MTDYFTIDGDYPDFFAIGFNWWMVATVYMGLNFHGPKNNPGRIIIWSQIRESRNIQ